MNDEELTNEETEKIIQFQQLTAIEDIAVVREILIRNNWNLEIAFRERERLNEGEPSVYATSQDVRAPAVINDRFLQHIFVSNNRNNNSNGSSSGIFGLFSYVVNSLINWCCTTLSSFIQTLLSIFTDRERSTYHFEAIIGSHLIFCLFQLLPIHLTMCKTSSMNTTQNILIIPFSIEVLMLKHSTMLNVN